MEGFILLVGATEGFEDDCLVGTMVAATVGGCITFVGDTVDNALGAGVIFVGITVGAILGLLVGDIVGPVEGLILLEGATEGFEGAGVIFVGITVGAILGLLGPLMDIAVGAVVSCTILCFPVLMEIALSSLLIFIWVERRLFAYVFVATLLRRLIGEIHFEKFLELS